MVFSKRSLGLYLLTVLLITGPIMGDWTEDWENYANNTSMTSPLSPPVYWDQAGTAGGKVFVNAGEMGTGDGGMKLGSGISTWGTAFRPGDGGVLRAKVWVYSGNGNHNVRIALTANQNVASGRPSGPLVELRLGRNGAPSAVSIHMTDGTNNTIIPALADTWYDFRLTDNGDNTVTGEYRLLNAPTWTLLDTFVAPGGWAPTYVAVSGLREGYIDDIDSEAVIVPGGGWVDDFESQTSPLTSPWEDASSFGTYGGSGYLGSTGAGGPTTGWVAGSAYRPTSAPGSNVLQARVFYSSALQFPTTDMALMPSKSTSVDNVLVRIDGTWFGPNNLGIMLRSEDFVGGGFVNENRMTSLITTNALNTWYDIRLTVNDNATATCHYKKAGTSRWINAGTVVLYDEFDDTYVRLASNRQAYFDDVAYLPEDLCDPYLNSDLNFDCFTDLNDLWAFAMQWLTPFDFIDYSAFQQQWPGCTDPGGACLGDLMALDYIARSVGQECDGDRWTGDFTVTVRDGENQPVSGASIQASFSGVHSGADSAITDAQGNAVVQTDCSSSYGVTTVTVDNIHKAGKFYTPERNAVSSSRRLRHTGPEVAGETKLITFGQVRPDSLVMGMNSEYFEDYLPFDGFSVELHRDSLLGRFGTTGTNNKDDCSLSWKVFGNDNASYSEYTNNVAQLQQASFQKLTDNLVVMQITSPWRETQDWFDDTLWNSVENNARIIARIAFDSGTKGLLFDDEAYGFFPSPWDWTNLAPSLPGNPQDWASWRDKVYDRGKQFIQALNDEFPGIHIMFLHGPYSVHASMMHAATGGWQWSATDMDAYHPTQGIDYSASEWALLMPFFCGMLEWADTNSEIICGSELTYFYKYDWEFAIARDIALDRCKAYSQNPTAYTDKVRMACGLWLTNEKALLALRFSPPTELANAVASALSHTDRYVWVYNEASTPWIRNVAEPPVVSNFAMYRPEDNNLTTPATAENAILPKFYATDHAYLEAMDDGKAQAKPDAGPIRCNNTSSGFTSTAGTTLSFSHTLSDDTNRALVVGVVGEDDSAIDLQITSVTCNGVSMAPIAGTSVTAGLTGSPVAFVKNDMYYLLEADLPTSGTYTVTVTYADNVSWISGGAVSLFSVKQQAAEAVSTNWNEGMTSIASGITTLSSQAWIIDVIGNGEPTRFKASAIGMTERFDISSSGNTAAASTLPNSATGLATLQWTTLTASRLAHSLAAFAPMD